MRSPQVSWGSMATDRCWRISAPDTTRILASHAGSRHLSLVFHAQLDDTGWRLKLSH